MKRSPQRDTLVRETAGDVADGLTQSPLRIDARALFSVPVEHVFQRLADLEGIGRFFPLIRSARVDYSNSRTACAPDVGTCRVCSVTGMGDLREEIVRWNPPHGYAYKAEGKLAPIRNHLGVFHLQRTESGSCLLVWRQYFQNASGPLGLLLGGMFPLVMQVMMKRALSNLLQQLGGEWRTVVRVG